MALAPATITLQNVAAANVVYNLRARDTGYVRYHQSGATPAAAQRVAYVHKDAKDSSLDSASTDTVITTMPLFDIDGNSVRQASARLEFSMTNRMTQAQRDEFFKLAVQALSQTIFKDQVEDGEILV